MTAGTDVVRAAKAAGFADSELVTAVALAYAASGLNADAISAPHADGSKDYGLWGISDSHGYAEISAGTWNNPTVNAAMAYRVYRAGGWAAWSEYKPTDPIGYARYLVGIPLATGYVTAAFGPVTGVKSGAAAPVAAAGGAVTPATAAFTDLTTMLRWIQDPRNWWRIAKVVIGMSLITAGVYGIVRGETAGTLTRAAATIARKAA